MILFIILEQATSSAPLQPNKPLDAQLTHYLFKSFLDLHLYRLCLVGKSHHIDLKLCFVAKTLINYYKSNQHTYHFFLEDGQFLLFFNLCRILLNLTYYPLLLTVSKTHIKMSIQLVFDVTSHNFL